MSSTLLAVGQNGVVAFHQRSQQPAPYRELNDREPLFRARPDVASLVDAISNAAACIALKDEQLDQFEQQRSDFEALAGRMKSKLGELMRLLEQTEGLARSEAARADRAEEKAASLQTRVQDLERDLENALLDLNRIADAITGSLMN